MHAIVGRKCLEVMPRDVSKAFAAKTIIESLVQLPLLSSRSGSTSSLPLSESDQEEDGRSVAGTGSEPSPLDFVLCIGDDRSDEEMFQYVNGLDNKNEEDKEKTKEDQQQQHPLRIVTCTVGSKSSEARWFVPGVTSVLQGLQLLADSASQDSDSVDHPSSAPAGTDAQVTLVGQ